MYNEQYHPVNEETLNWMLAGESKEHQDLIRAEVEKQTAARTRDYIVTLPDGTYYVIKNGIVTGSKGYRG